MRKRALIFGVSGQDGSLLAQLLLAKGYEVHGTSRDAEIARFDNLKRLGIFERVTLHSTNLNDFRSTLQSLRDVEPAEIYNLSAQSSVGLSFGQPTETVNSIVGATLNLLEAIRFLGLPARLANASSSEMFGDTGEKPADETAPFRPRSPYGIAKASAHWMADTYRQAYGIAVSSLILFNHESPLRNERFVTQKIVRAAVDIASGSDRKLTLGNLAIVRDWGWAEEYVEAMWLALQQDKSSDYVIATGVGCSLERFVALAFEGVGLDWRRHVVLDPALHRPYEVDRTVGDPGLAGDKLTWKPKRTVTGVVEGLVAAEKAKAREKGAGRGGLQLK